MTNNSSPKIEKINQAKDNFLAIAEKEKTPLYLYDEEEVQNNVRAFKKAFEKNGLKVNIFYATKSNPYFGLLKTVVGEGEGIDVSSQRELQLALSAGAQKIIYTGPAKTESDFELILHHHEKIIVNLESIRELLLLNKLAKAKGVIVRCGVRVSTANQKGWTKFGIPLSQLKDFYDQSKDQSSINFCGLHFHISMNKTPEPYVKTLNELSVYFEENFSKEELQGFKYIDMGGGFYPEILDGVYPWNKGQEIKYINDPFLFDGIYADKFKPRYIPTLVNPIDDFGKQIADVFCEKIRPLLPNAELYAEPGRFVSHSSMHIVLNLVEIKEEKSGAFIGITDGGNNMIGWEKYQFCNYVPIFNLSQFDATREIPFIIYGSLCTPDDIWGYYLYTKGAPQPGDILIMPYQGAYTYTLAQEFIKDVPCVYDL